MRCAELLLISHKLLVRRTKDSVCLLRHGVSLSNNTFRLAGDVVPGGNQLTFVMSNSMNVATVPEMFLDKTTSTVHRRSGGVPRIPTTNDLHRDVSPKISVEVES